jgi:DNA-binding NarL/FixJ family response regulator
MKPPTFVHPLSSQERHALRAGLRSPDAFTLRRCQVLLASADGQRPKAIAAAVGCCVQSVRNAVHAFHAEGLTERPVSIELIDGQREGVFA